MQKKKKIIKKLFSREKPVIKSYRKIERPWVMQYKWHSRETFTRNQPWMSHYNSDWQTHYDKYTDTEHALQMLNKELRTYFSWKKQQWGDKDSRLYNKKTGEILPLKVQDNKIVINNE